MAKRVTLGAGLGIAAGALGAIALRMGGASRAAQVGAALALPVAGTLGGALSLLAGPQRPPSHRLSSERAAWDRLWETHHEVPGFASKLNLNQMRVAQEVLDGGTFDPEVRSWMYADSLDEAIRELSGFDHDGDGLIDISAGSAELTRGRDGGPVTPTSGVQMLQQVMFRPEEADTDGDGKLNPSEAVASTMREALRVSGIHSAYHGDPKTNVYERAAERRGRIPSFED